MGRVYSSTFEGVAVTAVQDFWEFVCGSAVVSCIWEIHITQDTSETSEQLPVRLLRVPATVTSGSGGTTPAKNRKMIGDATSGATVEANNTTVATTTGTLEVIRRMGDNVLNGWHWVFIPETRIWVPPSGTFVTRLVTAPAASTPFSGELVWEEFG